jgi:hypothetical protein
LPRRRIPGEEKHEADAVSAKVSLADCASIAALLGSAFLASGLWYWLAYPPVQQYYLGAYFEGAFVGEHSTVAVPGCTRPLRERTAELAMVADVVSDSAGNDLHLPMKLSP